MINETLYPILNQHIYRAVKKPLPYKTIKGLKYIDKIIDINQTPIGRTPRSNPATYTGAFSEIRNLFAKTPEAQIRGYKPGRFSFNVKDGRCETCKGGGVRVIEMNFLPDVEVECETCQGKRFTRETLEIRYKGKSISDVLNMTISESVKFFKLIPKIYLKLKTIEDVLRKFLTKNITYHHIRSRKSGPFKYLDFHLNVPGNMSVNESHELCDRIEKNLKQRINYLDINIHVEPGAKN